VRHLLDVNVLLAAIWTEHSQHTRVFAWLAGKQLVLCPLCELGFLRISTNRKVLNAPMAKARTLLARFAEERRAERIPDDLPALESRPLASEAVTDQYLADLAAHHNCKLATLDEAIDHPSVEVIPH